MPVATCAILAVASGIVAHRSGLKRGVTAQQIVLMTTPPATSLEEQISDFGYKPTQLLAKLALDDSASKELERELAAQTEAIKHLKSSADQSAPSGSAENSRRDAELAAAQTNPLQLQAKADALGQEQENANGCGAQKPHPDYATILSSRSS